MIIDQLFTRPLFEEAPMASPEQLAYNRLRAQHDSYQTMTSGGGNTAVSRDPVHAAKLATVPAELARMAAALKAKGIDAEAEYNALSGPAAAPVDANQAYGGMSEGEVTKNATGLKHRATDKYGAGDDEPHHYTGGRSGFSEPGKYARDLEHVNKQLVKDLDASMGISWKNRGPKGLEVDEAAQGHTIEAHGVRGMDRRTWHKTFRNTEQMMAWAEKHDAEIIGTRDLEQARRGNLSPARQDMAEDSLNEFAPGGGEDGNSPYAYGMAILGYAEDYKQTHRKSSSTDDVADIIEIGNTFLNKGMAAGIAALFSVDTFVSDSIVDDLAEQGFNVMADLIDKRPRSAQWHQQIAAGQQALADYEANRKKSSEETNGSKAVDTLARVLKSSLQDYQAAAGDKNKLKQLGLLIGLSDNHRSAIHHALRQIQQNDFDGAIKSLVATPPGASGPGYDALDYGYSKQKAGVSVQQLIQSIRKHFELSEQGVAEGQQIDEVFADQGSGSTDRDNADYMKRRRAANKAGYTGRETKAGTWRVFKDGNAVAAAGPFKSADEAAAWIKKHKQGVTEMDKSEPSAGRDTGPREGPEKIAKTISKEKMVKHALDTLTKSMAKKDDKKKDVKESNTLMIKLKRALIREGRVKELADDLKAMSDADFMKKYGKAKAAIRRDMKRVDEAEGQTVYTKQEIIDVLTGKKTQQQVDAERAQKPLKEVDAPAIPAAPAAPAAPVKPAPQSNRQYAKTYNAATKQWTTNAPAANPMSTDPAQRAQNLQAAQAQAAQPDADEYNFDSWEQDGNMAVPLKNGVRQGNLFAMPVSQLPPGTKIVPRYTTYQQDGNSAYPVDANGGIQQLAKIPLSQVPKGAKIVQMPNPGGNLYKDLPGAQPAAPAAGGALSKNLPVAAPAASAPVSERKGTRRLREADSASPTYHNMGLKKQPMPAPGSTVAWDAPLHVNPSDSMGAPLPSGDPIETVKAGVQDAKEFYDLARKAGMPIGDAIPLAYKAGVATATGDIGGMVQAVTAHSNKNLDKGIQQLKSAIKDYADIYAQMLPTSEYYKKNIAPNPQLKAQADEFIKTNMTPQQFAQSINQAETAFKAPRTMPTQASPTVPSAQAALGLPAAPINELSTNKLAQYKTAAARDARQADQSGDFKRGDKRFHGIVQATKKQFDKDAKKVDESRAARRALMAQIVNHR